MKKILNILFLIVWMIVIFSLSNQKASVSTNTSNGFISNCINIFEKVSGIEFSDLQRNELIKNTSSSVRKLAHITEFLILAVLIINCVKDYSTNNMYVYSMLFAVLYSTLDELHQVFIPGRNGHIFDVLIDSIGIFIGTYFYMKIRMFKRKIKKK